MDKTKESEIYSKETIKIHIKDTHSNNPIVNAKVTLLAMGQKTGQKIPLDTPTDSNGEVLFNSKPYLKDINRFEITIEHKDYYSYPIYRTRKLCRSYEYGHLYEERFEKIPSFYYNGTTLAISPKINPFQKYSLKTQSLKSQAKQEYYIQLQENQKSLTIYKDRNLTQESAYTLCLDTTQTQQTGQARQTQDLQTQSQLSQSNTTLLNFESKESLERFTKDIQELIAKDKKKGNVKLVHRFVVGISGEYTSLLSLDKPQGRIVKIEIPKENVSDSIIANTESNQTKILKSWANTNQKITEQDIRKIAFSTIDIINRKDMSKNPLIYKALDKLIGDYRIYKDNFPQEYYVEFGRYIIQESISFHSSFYETHDIQQSNIIDIVNYSIGFWCRYLDNKYEKEWTEGGAAIFHLYENYVPKYNGDENGLDKVKHFTYSARLCFMKGPTLSFVGGMGVEIGDLLAQQIERAEKLFGRRTKIESTGFDTDDLKANKQGIDYGIELITKYRTFQ